MSNDLFVCNLLQFNLEEWCEHVISKHHEEASLCRLLTLHFDITVWGLLLISELEVQHSDTEARHGVEGVLSQILVSDILGDPVQEFIDYQTPTRCSLLRTARLNRLESTVSQNDHQYFNDFCVEALVGHLLPLL